ncbi:MAG: SlyX family protein [Phycisphaerales bacterium]
MPPPDHPELLGRLEARVTGLEEHAAFSERAVEELAAEVRLLNERVRDLGRKLAAAEARIGKVEVRGQASEDAPPACSGAEP